jgi:hypothetical protein
MGINRYMQRANISTQGIPSQDSFLDESFFGDYQGGLNLIYKCFARPGADLSAPVWQIAKLTYDGNNNVTRIQWPLNDDGLASNQYEFVADDRTSYTYN